MAERLAEGLLDELSQMPMRPIKPAPHG
jgi:hypothetical protein